jgi:hypothetical protein
MAPHDQERFKTFVAKFVETCGIEPPFHVILVGSNQSISVQRHTDGGIEPVCDHIVDGGFVAPITVTLIAPDGSGKGAMITIEAKRSLQ